MKRPTGPLCDGCHSVNYNVQTHAVTEWNVGCEKCHGPGSVHAAKPSRTNIVNPARLDSVSANDTCIQCHSQGQPLKNPIDGRYYDWPVGFEMGKDLKDYWKLEDHKLGETTFTHFADGTAHKNRMQGNDFVQSAMYTHGVTCFSCHDVHGTANNADLLKPANVMCLRVSRPQFAERTARRDASKRTRITRAGRAAMNAWRVTCRRSSRPSPTSMSAPTRSASSLPPEGERLKIPSGCQGCHADKGAAWATGAVTRMEDRLSLADRVGQASRPVTNSNDRE